MKTSSAQGASDADLSVGGDCRSSAALNIEQKYAVIRPGWAALPTLTLLFAAGCGGSSSSADINPAADESPATSISLVAAALRGSAADLQPPLLATKVTVASSPGGIDSKGSTGADLILIKPAGYADLPLAQVPAVQYKSLGSTAVSSTGRAVTRSAYVADGARSTVASDATLQSGEVTISWDPPTENADGSTINDLAGYRVYQGNQDQLSIVQELNETGAGERRLTQIADVTADNACFAVTAFDTSGNEGALGEVVCKDIFITAPPVDTLAPLLSSVTQLSSAGGQADIQLVWQPPASAIASAGASINQYSIYHGSQSQLFKIKEVSEDNPGQGDSRATEVSGIGGEQACFALTARYTDNTETSLSEIVCVALVHDSRPQPGEQLRPYNVSVDLIDTTVARISWDKPNTVVNSPDATAIDRYDLYQGSRSQVYKVKEINEVAAEGTTRSTTVSNVFNGSNCFALTATDESRRQSALSTIVCAAIPAAGSPPAPEPPQTGTIGVTNLSAQETSPGSVALAWDTPELVAAGQPIANLSGYNLYQGSSSQLFKVAEVAHSTGAVRQQTQRTEVERDNACFALTAYDINGYESPLSAVVCASVSGAPSVPRYGIVPPTDLATSALGGSSTVTLSWLASGAAATGAADPNVNRYNIYQGNHDRLFKVRQVKEEHNSDPRNSTTFTGVTPDSACFAITAQYKDLRESRLSEVVCRDE